MTVQTKFMYECTIDKFEYRLAKLEEVKINVGHLKEIKRLKKMIKFIKKIIKIKGDKQK